MPLLLVVWPWHTQMPDQCHQSGCGGWAVLVSGGHARCLSKKKKTPDYAGQADADGWPSVT
jgi:hypothetical protein